MSDEDDEREWRQLWSEDEGAPDTIVLVEFLDEEGEFIDVFSGGDIPAPEIGEMIFLGRQGLSMDEGAVTTQYKVLNKSTAYIDIETEEDEPPTQSVRVRVIVSEVDK